MSSEVKSPESKSTEAKPSETKEFSAGETKLFSTCFKYLKSAPDIDFEAVTAELGYKNVAVARANFNRAWKKHFKAPDGDANSPPKASTKAKVIKRKATNTADGSSKEAPQTGKATKRKAAETADGSSKEAPKRKRVSKAAKKIIKPDPTDDEAEDETNVKEEAGIEEDDEGNGNEDSNANEQTSTNSGEA